MKKKALFACAAIIALISSANKSSAQAWTTSGPDLITDLNTNNVGIGTTLPTTEKLTVNGDIGFENLSPLTPRAIVGHSDYLQMWSGNDGNTGSGMFLYSTNTTVPGSSGSIDFWSVGTSDRAFSISDHPNLGTFNSLLYLKRNGNLGLGDQTPLDRLSINGNIGFVPSISDVRYINGRSTKGLVLYSNTGFADGGGIMLWGNSDPGSGGSISFLAQNDPSKDPNGVSFTFSTVNTNGVWNYPMVEIFKNGKMAIGQDIIQNASLPGDYNLYVSHGILTERVKVALSSDASNWSDFVFNDDYKLKPLYEVANYISENKHLPEIPSTDEVHKNGVDLAEMDAKLLQKIEELTLYVIQQQKEIETLKKDLKK